MFWVAAIAMAGAVTLLMALAVRRGSGALPQERADGDVYRAQLREMQRDLARGVMSAEEGERLRVEVARRLLDATRAGPETAPSSRGPSRLGIALVVAFLIAGGVGGYLWLGAPGYPDLPLAARFAQADALRAERPSQAEAEARQAAQAPAEAEIDPAYLTLIESLRQRVTERPDDLEGQILLVRSEDGLGRYAAARAAQERVIALKGAEATGADRAYLGRLMVAAAGGVVTPEAEAVLAAALAAAPDDDTALFLFGIAQLQVGRADRGFQLWERFMQTAPPDSEWRAEVASQMPTLAQLAGVRYAAPEAARGPTAADVAAAADMSPEERATMVRGMVGGLEDRLAREGGPATDWARLIGALATLGEPDRARAIWQEAQTRFSGRDADLATLNAAADAAGLTE